MNFSRDAVLLAPYWGTFHMIDEWLGKDLDFPSTETTLESIKGSPHLLKKSMDTKFYVHTSVMQYYDTNIVFFCRTNMSIQQNFDPLYLR